jgi:HlyD family secretion protein
MAGGSPAALSRDIQTLFDSGTAVGLTDRQLLDRFAGHRDQSAEAAFEVLVHRHGPMVLRVCRNALPDPNDAQDAFQATFLVLVRQCGALKGLDSLGGWLYGVACRVAARARVEAARRRAVEGRAALRVVEAVEPTVVDNLDRDEFGPIVQDEVRRLPSKYRAAVVLCYWEGLTQEQAAAQLGCPLGTVRSRLARARDLLRRRLTRRGVEPLAIGMDATRQLPPPAAELVQSTVHAAMRLAAGQATNLVVSGAIASLVQSISWRTTMIKLSGLAAGMMLVGLAGYGAGLTVQRGPDGQANGPAIAGERGPTNDPLAGKNLAEAQVVKKVVEERTEKGEGKARSAVLVPVNVEGVATIVRVLPRGTHVKKGDVICELHSAPLFDQLVDQRIAGQTAEAAYLNAKLTREVAEIAVMEYRQGQYVDQLQDVEGRIKIAEAELTLAQDDLNSWKTTTGPVNPGAIKRAELAVLRATFALEQAQSKKKLLRQYTYEKTVKELESAVKKANADELAKQTIWSLMKQKERDLERRVAACTITAPIEGTLEHLRAKAADGFTTPVQEGVTVSGRQAFFTIYPVDQSGLPKDKSPGAKR